MKKNLFALIVPFILSGCDLEMLASVGLKETSSDVVTEGKSDIYLEISSCHSNEDSRIESKRLKEVKDKFPQVFPKAEYVECFSKEMKSYAHFTVPVYFGKGDVEKYDLLFKETKYSVLSAFASEALRKRYDDFTKSNNLNNLNIKIAVTITNNTGKDIKFKFMPAFLDGHPIINVTSVFDLKSGDSINNLLLSNVASSAIFGYSDNVDYKEGYGGANILLKDVVE
ncbi:MULTISPECIES: DUF7424 family protein [Pasteurellaceae]|uniref:DUF7424 domain-containing protein n=1 Tax=Mannheimia bovis TaxID=2770636 RepID=A0A7H1C0R9_9PAST|nr:MULTISPECIES: hypothetical protein [Pasteurellaceae]QNS14574.1 hypothetical protein ICJ55_07355 [Mannheimia bovis]VEB26151.1 Uncharacterised protein [Actinobacillus lignieresii]